jgi:hypothetical protein
MPLNEALSKPKTGQLRMVEHCYEGHSLPPENLNSFHDHPGAYPLPLELRGHGQSARRRMEPISSTNMFYLLLNAKANEVTIGVM